MQSLNHRTLSRKQLLVVASLLFGLFFGAGNLIFPLHLGQLAGRNWPAAAAGFLVTGVVLPLLSVLAIAITNSNGVYDVGRPLGAAFAVTFMVLIHATIGPLFGTPRTATVSFTVGVAPFVPKADRQLALLLFSGLFFLVAFLVSYKENNIAKNVGKLLNPLFLVLLFLVFAVAFLNPFGSPAHVAPTAAYVHGAALNGFLQGYNTMDALAGLAFGVTVVTAVRHMGLKSNRDVSVATAKAGVLSEALVAVVYLLLIVVGAMSLNRFKVSADGGVAFTQLVNAYAGRLGQAVLAAMITLTCLTTATGLVAAFGQDFHKHFPALSYRQWMGLSCLASFATANLGLDQIIAWSTPVLMFLYPLAMVLILLSVFSPLFHRDPVVYATTVALTVVPALLDMVVSFPSVVSASAFGKWCAGVRALLPLSSYGLSWLLPALVGAVLGVAYHAYHARQTSQSHEPATEEAQVDDRN